MESNHSAVAAVKENLKEVLARMGCGEDEAGRLLGGDVLASLV